MGLRHVVPAEANGPASELDRQALLDASANRRCVFGADEGVAGPDGVDQRDFLEGRQETSAREGFPYWMGDVLYGVKWQNFKLAMYSQRTLTEPAQKLASPYLINLTTDPGERESFDLPYLHSWVGVHFAKILGDFAHSVQREPPIPAGAPLDHVPLLKHA